MQIIAEALDAISEGDLRFNPARHEVVEHSHWMECVRSHLKRCGVPSTESLFLYYHKERRTYSIAMWTFRRGDIRFCKDLEVLKGHPDRLDWVVPNEMEGPGKTQRISRRPPSMEYLAMNFKPASEAVSRYRRHHIDNMWQSREEKRFQREGKADFVKHLRRKFGSGDVLADGIATGMIPFDAKSLGTSMGIDAHPVTFDMGQKG